MSEENLSPKEPDPANSSVDNIAILSEIVSRSDGPSITPSETVPSENDPIEGTKNEEKSGTKFLEESDNKDLNLAEGSKETDEEAESFKSSDTSLDKKVTEQSSDENEEMKNVLRKSSVTTEKILTISDYLLNASKDLEKFNEKDVIDANDMENKHTTVSSSFKFIKDDEADAQLKRLEGIVRKSIKDRSKNIYKIVTYAKEYGDFASSFSTMLKILNSACDLALTYLSSNNAFDVFQDCGNFLYEFSTNLCYYFTVKTGIKEESMSKIEDIRNMAKRLTNIPKRKSVVLEITYVLVMCTIQRELRLLKSSKSYIDEASTLLYEHTATHRLKQSIAAKTLNHICKFLKDVGIDGKCPLHFLQVYKGFLHANSIKPDESTVSDLYFSVYQIGISFFKTSHAQTTEDAEKTRNLDNWIKNEVLQTLRLRSESDLQEIEILPNLLSVIWLANETSKKKLLGQKIPVLQKITLKIPKSLKLYENIVLLSASVLDCQPICVNPIFKYKLAEFAFDVVVKLVPDLRMIGYLKILINGLMKSEKKCPVFRQHTIPFLHQAIEAFKKACTDDEITKMRFICDAHLYLCWCHAELEEFEDCLNIGTKMQTLLEPYLEYKENFRVALMYSETFYIFSFVYYKTERLNESLNEIRSQVNTLNLHWIKHPRSFKAALQNFAYVDSLIKGIKNDLPIPELLYSFMAFYRKDWRGNT